MQFVFGAGQLIVTPLTDAYGNAIANATPRRLGGFQEGSFDNMADLKKAQGANAFPIAIARGKQGVSVKVKALQFSIDQFNALMVGQPANLVSSLVSAYVDNNGTAIPGTPYTITPTVPGSGTFVRDLGVQDGNGAAFTNMGSSSAVVATGQYSVSAGVYTFYSGDSGKTVFISFTYSNSASPGKSLTVKNVAMGQVPLCSCDLICPYGGNTLLISLYQTVFGKFTFGTKIDDFTTVDFEIEAFSDSQNRIYTISGGQ